MNDSTSSTGAKQQIVEQIKDSTNILVTVSTNPSVDELSAALGLTIMLNGMNKHATAVVSGDVPPAIDFLEPGKTFENTVDSLRDFIIALDKEKADHLRYKVDGDVVKIFITPYRTTIDETDLDFSQGDYNVELVLALGVTSKEYLDKALGAHGRILHDATVATINCREKSKLGSIDWVDEGASSISEMLVALSEALKKDKPVLDEQSASALLTGIVASTDRFSNDKTSSKVMTMAAQLMAAGANQQLIATRLEEANEIGEGKKDNNEDTDDSDSADGTTALEEGKSSKVDQSSKSEPAPPKDTPAEDGSLSISHEKEGDLDEVARQVADEKTSQAAESAESKLAEAEAKAESDLSKNLPAAATPSVEELQKDIIAASEQVDDASGYREPILGGTLNATTEQAAETARQEAASTKNKKILSHGSGRYVGDEEPIYDSPLNAAMQPSTEPKSVDIFDDQPQSAYIETPVPQSSAPMQSPVDMPANDVPQQNSPSETLADIDSRARQQTSSQAAGVDEREAAQAAVAEALDGAPFDPANNPRHDVGANQLGSDLTPPLAGNTNPDMPAVPDFSLPPPLPPEMPQMPAMDALPPPPLPQGGAIPTGQLGSIFGNDPALSAPPVQPLNAPEQPADPNQFQIPSPK